MLKLICSMNQNLALNTASEMSMPFTFTINQHTHTHKETLTQFTEEGELGTLGCGANAQGLLLTMHSTILSFGKMLCAIGN